MPLTQAQIFQIKKEAKLKGFSDEQINTAISEMMDQYSASTGQDTLNTSGVSVNKQTQTTAPTTQTTTKTGGEQMQSTEEPKLGIVGSFFKSLYKTGADYASLLGEAGLQAGRAAFSNKIVKPDMIDSKVKELGEQSRELIAQAKKTTDPAEKEQLLNRSRELDKQIDELGQLANEYGAQRTTFLMDEDKIATQKDIVLTGARATAGAAAYAIPGGKTVGSLVAAGALSGGLSAFAEEDSDIKDVLNGSVAGAAFGALTGVTMKALQSTAAKRVGSFLKDKASGLRKSQFVKTLGGKPLAREGGDDLLKRMINTGFDATDPDDIVQQANKMLMDDGNLVYDAARRLSEDGVTVQADDLLNVLQKQIDTAKSSVTKKPLQEVLDIIKNDLGDASSISLDDLYLLKTEYGGLGRWNSLSSAVEKKQAEAWRQVYTKANELLDDSLKAEGFKDFRAINERLHTAMQASQYAARRGNVAPNQYNIGLYDWIAGVGGAASTGGVAGGVATVAAKKALESPKTVGILSNILKRTGEFAEKIQPLNAELPDALRNTITSQIGKSVVSEKEYDQGDTASQYNATNQLTQQDNLSGTDLTTDKTTIAQEQKKAQPFGGRSKNDLMQLALAEGASYSDLEEIGKVYDLIVGTEDDLDTLLSRRKSLSEAGISTAEIDKQLTEMGYSMAEAGKVDITTQIQNLGTAGERNSARSAKDILDVVDSAIATTEGGVSTGPFAALTAQLSKLTGPNKTAKLEKDLSEILRTIRKESTGVSFSKEEIRDLEKEIPTIVQQEGNVEDSLKRLRIRMLQKLENYGIDVTNELQE